MTATRWKGYPPVTDAALRADWRADHEPWPDAEPVESSAVEVDRSEPFGWLAAAACRGMDPDLFHPVKTEHGMTAIAAAKRVCAGCPVRAECLEYALDNCERLGVWGGLSERERRTLRGQRRRAAS